MLIARLAANIARVSKAMQAAYAAVCCAKARGRANT